MSAPGIQAAVLGLFLLLGVTAQGGKNGLIIRPGLPELCKEAPNTSDCDVAVQFRWYYDMFSDSCMVFPHRGCANSPNIFKNRKECVQVCIKTPASTLQKEEHQNTIKYTRPEGKSAKQFHYSKVADAHGSRHKPIPEDGEQVFYDGGYAIHNKMQDRLYRNKVGSSYQPYGEHHSYNLYNDKAPQVPQNKHSSQFISQHKKNDQFNPIANKNTLFRPLENRNTIYYPQAIHNPNYYQMNIQRPPLIPQYGPQLHHGQRSRPKTQKQHIHGPYGSKTQNDGFYSPQLNGAKKYVARTHHIPHEPYLGENSPRPILNRDHHNYRQEQAYDAHMDDNRHHGDYIPQIDYSDHNDDRDHRDHVPPREHLYPSVDRAPRDYNIPPRAYFDPSDNHDPRGYNPARAYINRRNDRNPREYIQLRGHVAPRELRGHKGIIDQRDHRDYRDHRDHPQYREHRDPRSHRDQQELREYSYHSDQEDPRNQREIRDNGAHRDPRNYRDRIDERDNNEFIAHSNIRNKQEHIYNRDDRDYAKYMQHMDNIHEQLLKQNNRGSDTNHGQSQIQQSHEQINNVDHLDERKVAPDQVSYYEYEEPDHPARSPKDEHYYGNHKHRPDNVPPNMYIYGEGPFHPSEVPMELQDYDPEHSDRERYHIEEEFDQPQDGTQEQEKKPFVHQSGYAPRPLTGAFPGIPTDRALRRFRLRSGWVIEIIQGGFRAIKDEREVNGWRHVYARIYREAPDASAGRSIWMFQSEFEPPEDDHSPPPEYLQHVTNNNNNNYGQHQHARRHKRHVPSFKSHHWFSVSTSLSSSVILPKPWEDTTSVDQLDEIYGEPVMKPEIGNEPGRMPFIAAESNQAPPRPPIEGRSIRGSPYSSNFRPRSDPLMRPAPGSYNSNPKPYGPSVGFPPRGLQRMPHDEQHPMGSAGRFGRQQNYNDKHGRRPAPGPLTESFEEESPIDLMTDQDILDKIDLFGKKPNESQPMPKKAAADSDFMSDSDIFENRQEKDLYGEKPTMDNGQNAMEGKDENEADVVNAKVAPPCMQIPETGPCRAYIRRWYFDPREHDCFTFIFGGCDGNKNSFETKYDCMKRCAMPSEEMEQASSEPMTPLSSKRQQFGLRRQRNPPPVVLTSPAANRTPPVTSAPVQTEGTNAELEQIDSQQSGDDSLDGVDNSGSESGSQELSTTSIEGRQADSLPRVTNHYYTYHNYGPRHTNYGAFRTSSKSSEDNSASTLSEEENDQEKKIQKKSRKQKKKKNGSSKPTPFNMFFKFLRRLRPRKPRIMMHSEERPEGHRGKQGGVKLVTLLFTKRGRQQDSVNPFSSLMSLTAPRQSNPFSIFFNRPEPREVPDFRPHPPHYKSGLPYAGEALHYNNGPQYNHGPQYNSRPPYEHGPHSHYDNRPHYFNGPHFNSPPFLKGPNFYHSPESMSNPIRSLLFPPVDRLVSPMSNILNQFQSPFFSTNRVAPHGEKNVACGKPIDVGSCPGSPLTSQWYYDAQRGVCDVFFYTGCGGNENRFGSLKQCHDVCVVMTPAPPIAQSKPAEETNAISPVTVVVDPVPPQPKEPQPVQPEKSHSEQLEQIETEQQPEPVQILEVQPELELPAEETPEFNIVKEEQYEIEKEEQEEEKEKVKEEEKQAEAQKEAKQLMEEKPVEEREVIVPHQVIQATPVVHTFEFSNMRLDTRMEYVLVVIIMILGGAALIVLVAITAYFMYKKHKLAVRNQKEASIQKVFQAHAYPEVQKISVIELLRQGQGQLPAVHDVVLKNADPNIS